MTCYKYLQHFPKKFTKHYAFLKKGKFGLFKIKNENNMWTLISSDKITCFCSTLERVWKLKEDANVKIIPKIMHSDVLHFLKYEDFNKDNVSLYSTSSILNFFISEHCL